MLQCLNTLKSRKSKWYEEHLVVKPHEERGAAAAVPMLCVAGPTSQCWGRAEVRVQVRPHNQRDNLPTGQYRRQWDNLHRLSKNKYWNVRNVLGLLTLPFTRLFVHQCIIYLNSWNRQAGKGAFSEKSCSIYVYKTFGICHEPNISWPI